MPAITESVRIPLHADILWRRIGGFGAVGDWHPMLAKLEGQGDHVGALRIAWTRQGDRQVERLESFDPAGHTYGYRVESSPLPVRDYEGVFQIIDEDMAVSRVLWTARFEVAGGEEAKTVEMVRSFLRAGLENLKKLYG
jgi:mxaD protein